MHFLQPSLGPTTGVVMVQSSWGEWRAAMGQFTLLWCTWFWTTHPPCLFMAQKLSLAWCGGIEQSGAQWAGNKWRGQSSSTSVPGQFVCWVHNCFRLLPPHSEPPQSFPSLLLTSPPRVTYLLQCRMHGMCGNPPPRLLLLLPAPSHWAVMCLWWQHCFLSNPGMWVPPSKLKLTASLLKHNWPPYGQILRLTTPSSILDEQKVHIVIWFFLLSVKSWKG